MAIEDKLRVTSSGKIIKLTGKTRAPAVANFVCETARQASVTEISRSGALDKELTGPFGPEHCRIMYL